MKIPVGFRVLCLFFKAAFFSSLFFEKKLRLRVTFFKNGY